MNESHARQLNEQEIAKMRAKQEQQTNEQLHLNHPFYKRVENVVNEVAREQIIYGAGKYPEPFNPMSWTPKELLWHNLKELRDATVYSVGLFEQIEHMEEHSRELQQHLNEWKDKARYIEKEHTELKEDYEQLEKKYDSAKEELEQHNETLIQTSRTFVKELGEKNKEIERLQEENKRLNGFIAPGRIIDERV